MSNRQRRGKRKKIAGTGPPKQVRAMLDAALRHHSAGDLQRATVVYQEILARQPKNPEALHLLGLVEHGQGRHRQAKELIRRALATDPHNAHYHGNLGEVLRALGEREGAIKSLRKALHYHPGHCPAYKALGQVFHEAGRWKEARSAFRKAIRCDEDDADSVNNLGIVHQHLGDFKQALRAFAQAVLVNPRHVAALGNLGLAAQRLASPDSADLEVVIGAFRCSLASLPENASAWNTLGMLLKRKGDLTEAMRCFESALKLEPQLTGALANLARMRRFGASDGSFIDQLKRQLAAPGTTPEQRSSLNFALGKVHDDRSEFAEAFACYAAGNRFMRETSSFDREAGARLLVDIRDVFTEEFFAAHTDFGLTGESPIFIVGMMRSGTTLVEQILATHPQVFGLGEHQEIPRLARILSQRLHVPRAYPHSLAGMDAHTSRDLGREYLQSTRKHDDTATLFTDKLPGNYLYLGFIALLFPDARVIHCHRDPLDDCLSLFFQKFEDAHSFSYDLTDIGIDYRRYRDIMTYWRAVLPLEVLDVSYESLVLDQEATSRRMVEYCGLAWDNSVLNFYANDRPVHTASDWQVRQPVYDNSIGRSRAYEEYLGPLKEALGL